MGAATPVRRASDGSPYPDRRGPAFEREVRAMFEHIAARYNWFDHVASLGGDFLWRPRALWALERHRRGRPTRRILDIGCGTGELSRLASRRFPSARVTGLDFTAGMLAQARVDARAAGPAGPVDWVQASALAPPLRAGRFDVVMSAFVIRNLPDLPRALQTLAGLLAPGGTLFTLEITEPRARWVRAGFHAYFDHVVPWLGRAVDSAGPYRYLPESLRHLPSREALLRLLDGAGLPGGRAVPQHLGIVTTYLADRPQASR